MDQGTSPCCIIDTHCHLDVKAFDPDRQAVLERARAAGVEAMLIPSVDAAGWPGLLRLCREHGDLYPALGLHPCFCGRHTEGHIEQLQDLIEREQPNAIGEIGLDFYVDNPDRQRQSELLERQLVIARDTGLPAVLHVRKAHNEALSLLKRIRPPGGIAHAFNGSMEIAREYLELGFVLGFGGMLTYERSSRLRKLAKQLPLDTMVLETDAPDMTVAAHQGERNSPEYLPDCLMALALVRDEDPATVAGQTSANAKRVLGMASE